jgi:hypothetical protein
MTPDRIVARPGIVLLVGAVLVTAGTFLTWTRLPGAFPGDTSWFLHDTGIDDFRGKGVFVLGIALIALGILALLDSPAVSIYRGPIGMAACLAATNVILLLLWRAASLRSTREPLQGSAILEAVELHTGWGMAVSLVGAVAVLWGGYRTIRSSRISDPGEA